MWLSIKRCKWMATNVVKNLMILVRRVMIMYSRPWLTRIMSISEYAPIRPHLGLISVSATIFLTFRPGYHMFLEFNTSDCSCHNMHGGVRGVQPPPSPPPSPTRGEHTSNSVCFAYQSCLPPLIRGIQGWFSAVHELLHVVIYSHCVVSLPLF